MNVRDTAAMMIRALAVILPGVLLARCGFPANWNHLKTVPSTLTPAAARSIPAPLKLPLESPRIVVQKGRRRLLLISGSKLLRTYAIGLGTDPTGNKLREGDGRTPEGRFYITAKNPRSHYFMSLQVSYPDMEAARRGLNEKLITASQYRRIAEAIRRHRTPPQDTPLGCQVFIHGGGSNSNWTLGCVALDNKNMRELYAAVEVGTPVVIYR